MVSLRFEALQMLAGKGAVLETAREVTRVLQDHGLSAPVIGGVAVVLHGYTRTTSDVDVFVGDRINEVAEALKFAGFRFRKARSEFIRDGVPVPVHLVTASQTAFVPRRVVDREEIETVSLPDLVELKLRSGVKNPLRAIDLADVIGLIRARKLDASFASRLGKEVRPEFRKLARAVWREQT